jgi:hypothetical protein
MSYPLIVLIVEKLGNIKQLQIKEYNEKDLYKKCGFKSDNNFNVAAQWKLEGQTIKLYGKTIGKPNTENKYEFPPPADNTLFFGNCLLLAHEITKDKNVDLTLDKWTEYYEILMKGFEDLTENDNEEDKDEDDEEDEDDDDFIIDDKDELNYEPYIN